MKKSHIASIALYGSLFLAGSILLNACLFKWLTHDQGSGLLTTISEPFQALLSTGQIQFNGVLSLYALISIIATSICLFKNGVWRYIGFHLVALLILFVLASFGALWLYIRLFLNDPHYPIRFADLYFLFHPRYGEVDYSLLSIMLAYGVAVFVYASYLIFKVFGVGMTLGKSRFAHAIDIDRAGLFNAYGKGIVLGKSIYGMLRYTLYEPILIISGVGGGKTKSIAVPNLFELPNENFIVTDVKGEIYETTAPYRLAIGNAVQKFQPESDDTARYNPFALIRPSHVGSDLDMIFNTIIPDSKDPIWANVGRNIGKMIALFLIEHHKKTPTFQEIFTIACSPTLVEALTDAFELLESQSLKNLAGMFLQYNTKFRQEALVNTQNFLQPFDEKRLAYATSGNDFDFSTLRKVPTTIYLVVPANTEIYNGICAMFFEQAIRLSAQANEPSPDKLTLNLLIDEFGNLPKMPAVDKGTSWLRSYRIRIIAFVQRISQVEAIYGRTGKDSFLSCPVKVAFKVDSENDRQFVSRLTGKTTVKVRNHSNSQGGGSVSYQKQAKDLMTPDEVGRLPYKNLLICVTGHHPIKARKNFYTKNREYKGFY